MDAGQRAYRIGRMTDIARWQARGAGLLVEAAKEQDSRHYATMHGLLLVEIDDTVAGTMATCKRIMAVVRDQDPCLIDPREDEDGVYIVRSGSNPALRDTIDAIWAEDNGVAAVEECWRSSSSSPRMTWESPAVHEVREQITDYDR